MSLAFPPGFIFCRPSVQQGMTRSSWKVAGSQRSTELSKTVGQAYAVDGAPDVEIGQIEIFLHDAVMIAA